ncbi:ferritin family protein [Saccharicrinis sp. FJH2]|uniref:ferritin-like domain-containing protein n=1 Tax=unclassified Saccharicrinis TaxID=2646859 RepID=UPI0035D4AC40
MKTFNTIDEILDFAMDEEQKAVEFYAELASKAKTRDMKAVFEEFAKEEVTHKVRLLKIKEEGIKHYKKAEITDLKISDYVARVKVEPEMSYEQALVVAMNKEKAAFRLYMALADKAPTEELKNVFLDLAQEESKHKLRFEIEYDDLVYREN